MENGLSAAKHRLQELCELPNGWDGYQAKTVSYEVANFAFAMLKQIYIAGTAPPQIVPGPNGDLQLEWHTECGDVELHVSAPYKVHAWRSFVAAPENAEECELTSNFTPIARWVREVFFPYERKYPSLAAY